MPTPEQCVLYVPGHRVHYIQARLSREGRRGLRVPARVLDATDTEIVIESDETLRRLRHHDMPRFAATIAKHGRHVLMHEAFGLLFVPSGGGHAIFFVADGSDPWPSCEAPPEPVDPFTALTSHGGFVVHGTPQDKPVDGRSG